MKITSIDAPGWEDVRYAEDPDSGLRAIIAVHDVTLGPALGGCRRWVYDRFDDALEDVKRLSRGMTYKNSLAQLALGGGKSVIMAEKGQPKTPELFQAFGRFVDAFGGLYISAEDVGVSEDDMAEARKSTRHVVGLKEGPAASGDPSPFTALGVFHGLRAAAEHRFGTADLNGVRVAVQGLGSVGRRLAEHLHRAGAKLIVADINEALVAQAADALGAQTAAPDAVLSTDVDIIAPCALGGAVNEELLKTLKAPVIAGGANNQLATPEIGAALMARGVVYAPDYAINAGGVINVMGEVEGRYDRTASEKRAEGIYDIIKAILERAAAENRQSNLVADDIAMERIARARAEGHRFEAA